MSVLENLEPKSVFGFFEKISSIPHGSHDCERISNYLVDFAKERNLEVHQDSAWNVIIIKEATEGYENAAPVIIQGHMDMVCEKTADSDFDFDNDGLKLMIDGDVITADGTTLGGDDGIAVAIGLALLDADDIAHPRLEVVITSDEEVGLLGAEAIDVSPLKGRKMINIDSEEEGIFTASCAGGVSASALLPVERESVSGQKVRIVIDGLLGGHSGIEINKERASANTLIARVLYELQDTDFRVIELAGGQKDNAICKLTKAEIVVSADKAGLVKEAVEKMSEIFKHEYRTPDPDVNASAEILEEGEFSALTAESTDRVLTYLMNSPQGVQNMSKDIEGLVETSLNMGALLLEENQMKAVYAVRSSAETRKTFIVNKLTSLVKALGGKIELAGGYPGWEYRAQSALRDTAVSVYRKLYGKDPEIAAIHAGLECGLFAGKMGPELDCISIGPDMTGVHTPDETLSISSTKRVWEFIIEVLKESK